MENRNKWLLELSKRLNVVDEKPSSEDGWFTTQEMSEATGIGYDAVGSMLRRRVDLEKKTAKNNGRKTVYYREKTWQNDKLKLQSKSLAGKKH